MRNILMLAVGLLGVASALQVNTVSGDDFPSFDIDLDLKPEERFQEITRHFREEIIGTTKAFVQMLPKPLITLFDKLYWLQFFTAHEKFMEMRGVWEALDSEEVTLANAIMINTLYEIEAWCTSVIVRTENGKIIHQRNLDFQNPDFMRSAVYRGNFKKDGEKVFSAILFAGNVGIYTGFKEDKFSISENERWPETDKKGLLYNLVMAFTGYNEISWIIRDALTNANSWEEARAYLSNEDISALGYIILAGIGEDEGVVITRNRLNTAHEERLNTTNWFLVQTNNDHWDTGCYNRCAAATERIEAIGQENINSENLREDVLLQWPSNNYRTLYNTIMEPSTGKMQTISVKYTPSELEPEVGKGSFLDDDDQFDQKGLFALSKNYGHLENELELVAEIMKEFVLEQTESFQAQVMDYSTQALKEIIYQ